MLLEDEVEKTFLIKVKWENGFDCSDCLFCGLDSCEPEMCLGEDGGWGIVDIKERASQPADAADKNICKDCGKPMGNPTFCIWCEEGIKSP